MGLDVSQSQIEAARNHRGTDGSSNGGKITYQVSENTFSFSLAKCETAACEFDSPPSFRALTVLDIS